MKLFDHPKFGLYFFSFLLLFTLGCKKSTTKTSPTIASFTITTTMTTATFSINASNYTSLSISIDGAPAVSVGGSSYTASGLTANKNYVAVLTATNANGSATASQSFTTSKSSLAITSFTATDTTESSINLNFSASSDMTITSAEIINDTTGEAVNVIGKISHSISNLLPSHKYSFTYKVKDNTGNEMSKSITFTTKAKVSDALSYEVSYGQPFAIIGNAQSDTVFLKIINESSAQIILKKITVSFGIKGNAVRSLRYQTSDTSWAKFNTVGNLVHIANVKVLPGINTFKNIFALKSNLEGFSNADPLSFQIIDMEEEDGSRLPKNGAFPPAIPAGSIDAITQPTIITSSWNSDAYLNARTWTENNQSFNEHGVYQVINIKATGPAGARFVGIRLKNPYYKYPQLEFDNSSWKFIDFSLNTLLESISNVYWKNEFVSLVIPNNNDRNIINTNGTFNTNYYISCGWRNVGPNPFSTGNDTPGRSGFQLISKYDVILKNASGQVISLDNTDVIYAGVKLEQ